MTTDDKALLVLPSSAETQIRLRAISEFQIACRNHLTEGPDYGTIPGTDKPTLLKPGAEKIVKLLGLSATYPPERIHREQDWDKPFFAYEVVCRLTITGTDVVVDEGFGECNSYESKYRWRNEQRTCPSCDAKAIIKGKAEFGGGWVCWKKKDGCGQKFQDGDKSIESQVVGRVLNEDIADQVNTMLKMAKKRALVDAALSAGRLSDIFTQDLEELQHVVGDDAPEVVEGEAVAVTHRDVPPEEIKGLLEPLGFTKLSDLDDYMPGDMTFAQWDAEKRSIREGLELALAAYQGDHESPQEGESEPEQAEEQAPAEGEAAE